MKKYIYLKNLMDEDERRGMYLHFFFFFVVESRDALVDFHRNILACHLLFPR